MPPASTAVSAVGCHGLAEGVADQHSAEMVAAGANVAVRLHRPGVRSRY